jgi:hypothetical protein
MSEENRSIYQQFSWDLPEFMLRRECYKENIKLLGDYVELSDEEVGNLTSPKFVEMMKKVYAGSIGFGLCGVIATYASGLASRLRTWQEIDVPAVEVLSQVFKDKIASSGRGKSAIELFRETHSSIGADEGEPKTIDGLYSLNRILDGWGDGGGLSGSQGLVVAPFLKYHEQKGSHTHWLSLTKDYKNNSKSNEVILLGDFSPFGLSSCGVRIKKATLAESLFKVLGQIPSTIWTPELTAEGYTDKYLDRDGIQTNGIVFSFVSPKHFHFINQDEALRI